MTTSDLQGRTAVVTGASRGIGLAIASSLAQAGANVVVTSRDRAATEQAAHVPRSVGIAAHATDETAARACTEQAMRHFGSIDILVNNAGSNPAFGPLVDQDHARFAKTMDVNLWAPVLWTGLAWRAWMREYGGAVINTASIGAFVVEPSLGIYRASKAALVHLTRHLAVELAPSVRVNAVALGVVRTRLAEALWKGQEAAFSARTPLGRIGEPTDVAGAVTFLASDTAAWITGETMVIDGGQALRATSSGPPAPGPAAAPPP